ncbi:group III truncated hemoglobin [Pontibacter sp. 13R65]|uniref:group III truncated hemoglobin n=1 Tax=Pontibacter sp. 13R65 TaxID=3127458 RepID=UPI00301E4A6D
MNLENKENKDILTLEDIKALVDTFYSRIREDELLAPVFEDRIKGNWEKHLDTMYRFWQTVLLEERTYQGSPGMKHITLPVGEAHFEQWLRLFYKTIDELFVGQKAQEAKWRAARMAEMFAQKISYFQRNKGGIL